MNMYKKLIMIAMLGVSVSVHGAAAPLLRQGSAGQAPTVEQLKNEFNVLVQQPLTKKNKTRMINIILQLNRTGNKNEARQLQVQLTRIEQGKKIIRRSPTAFSGLTPRLTPRPTPRGVVGSTSKSVLQTPRTSRAVGTPRTARRSGGSGAVAVETPSEEVAREESEEETESSLLDPALVAGYKEFLRELQEQDEEDKLRELEKSVKKLERATLQQQENEERLRAQQEQERLREEEAQAAVDEALSALERELAASGEAEQVESAESVAQKSGEESESEGETNAAVRAFEESESLQLEPSGEEEKIQEELAQQRGLQEQALEQERVLRLQQIVQEKEKYKQLYMRERGTTAKLKAEIGQLRKAKDSMEQYYLGQMRLLVGGEEARLAREESGLGQ